jgi:hypothetical protein
MNTTLLPVEILFQKKSKRKLNCGMTERRQEKKCLANLLYPIDYDFEGCDVVNVNFVVGRHMQRAVDLVAADGHTVDGC